MEAAAANAHTSGAANGLKSSTSDSALLASTANGGGKSLSRHSASAQFDMSSDYLDLLVQRDEEMVRGVWGVVSGRLTAGVFYFISSKGSKGSGTGREGAGSRREKGRPSHRGECACPLNRNQTPPKPKQTASDPPVVELSNEKA